MPAFSAKDVQTLRRSTGVGMLDAKKALEENDGDMDRAIAWLREQGLASQAKRADREASEGAVAIGRSGSVASIVQLRSETDFVAKSDEFVALAHDIAAHIAFARPSYISRDQVPESEVAAERETVEKIARNEGKPDAALPKIVEGRLNGWYKERVLLDQPYVKDEKQTIATLLGPAQVTQFAQVVVGD